MRKIKMPGKEVRGCQARRAQVSFAVEGCLTKVVKEDLS